MAQAPSPASDTPSPQADTPSPQAVPPHTQPQASGQLPSHVPPPSATQRPSAPAPRSPLQVVISTLSGEVPFIEPPAHVALCPTGVLREEKC